MMPASHANSRRAKIKAIEPLALLTTQEAATRMRVSYSMVQRLIRNKTLASIKIGKLRRIPIKSIDAFMAKAEKEAKT